MVDVAKLLRGTQRSERQLGAEILARWKKLERARPKFPLPQVIASKLGLLRKGNPKWWSNAKQSKALQALAEILGCAPEEIVAPDHTSVGAVSITTFPELAPILPGQEACQLRDDGSSLATVVTTLLRDEPRSWVIAPPGAGKSLALDVLQQRQGSRLTSLRCRRLVDAVKLTTKGLPILIEVSEVDQMTDEAALGELSKAPVNVCVLAPFSLDLVPTGKVRWHDVRWAQNSDWRVRLLKWAHARCPRPQHLEVDEVLEALHILDPDERLFSTPQDVLTVAARAYRSKLPTARAALLDLAREHLGRTFNDSDAPWVRTFGVAAVESLVQRRFLSTGDALGPLDPKAWARLLPADLAPWTTPKALNGRERTKVPDAPPPIQAVQLLIDLGALRTQADGRFDVAPWIRAGIERELLRTTIKGNDLSWALLGIEPGRRVVVDGSLDDCSPSTLLALLRRVLDADTSRLESVAALEALFSAFARRLASGWDAPPDSIPPLQELGRLQLELVRRQPSDHSFPGTPALTRQPEPPRHNSTTAGRPTRRWYTASRISHTAASWVGEAWTFSFGIEAPDLDADPGWIMPGWSRDLRLASAPDHLPHADEDRLLLAASRRALESCQDPVLPPKVSSGLLEWVLIDGPARGWTITEEIQARLVSGTGVGEVVARLLLSEPQDVREQGARTVWNAVLAQSGLNPFHALDLAARVSRALHTVIVENISVGDFAEPFRGTFQVTMDEGRVLLGLPPRLVRPALLALIDRLERDQQPAKDLEPILEALGEEDLDLLLRFGSRGYTEGYAAARRVWALAPEMANERLGQALASGDRLARVWFDTAPDDRLDDLLSALRQLEGRAPAWSTDWLAGMLPRSGRAAAAAYDLLRAIQGRT